MSVLWVTGPSGAGPGERAEMLEHARTFLRERGVAPSDVVRVDVPGRGAGEEGDGTLRAELEPMVPMLQSGSLFGGTQGLMLVDAQNLNVAEADILANMLGSMHPGSVAIALVVDGSLHKRLVGVLQPLAEKVAIKKMWENQMGRWLVGEIEMRGLSLDSDAAQALIQRFGTDTASLGQALDQLGEAKGRITAADVLNRFRNRPNEPIFHFTDAVTRGDVGEALRRLSDLMTHQHPLVILASLERELSRRALALSAPDLETFKELAGARPSDRWPDRLWRDRKRLRDSSLRRGLDALVRADRVLKSAPEEMHRVTMERLTVAMCRWMVGK